jgi:2-C-methyl-D-erythritol 4-phosphate cytidylyltransferase/2-C-methyl-D-erythritol 2,4-cyclodiphosphate synthase
MSHVRVGHGFDVHRYRPGGPMRLCGVDIDCAVELEGHSDADVALHALTDAILGALAAGDIGDYFPPADPRWRNADSEVFLHHALDLARERAFRLVNCDLTLVGERPRIADHRHRLRQSLAALLELAVEAVSIKATTTEGLGFTGRGEGLAAMAVVLLAVDDDG